MIYDKLIKDAGHAGYIGKEGMAYEYQVKAKRILNDLENTNDKYERISLLKSLNSLQKSNQALSSSIKWKLNEIARIQATRLNILAEKYQSVVLKNRYKNTEYKIIQAKVNSEEKGYFDVTYDLLFKEKGKQVLKKVNIHLGFHKEDLLSPAFAKKITSSKISFDSSREDHNFKVIHVNVVVIKEIHSMDLPN